MYDSDSSLRKEGREGEKVTLNLTESRNLVMQCGRAVRKL
jgi:hypothetical protein